MLIKKSAVVAALAMLVATMVFGASAHSIYAADCNAVMNELYSGKHPKEVAKDLSISTSSVYRCKRHAQAGRKATTKTSLQAQSGRDGTVPQAPAPSASDAASSATTR